MSTAVRPSGYPKIRVKGLMVVSLVGVDKANMASSLQDGQARFGQESQSEMQW